MNASGLPVAGDEHSLTVGSNGPTVPQDDDVVQKMQHFNRERVPERALHAKGSADTVRGPRGFAMKFYTDDGSYDPAGNKTPMFFIRDALQFSHSSTPRSGCGRRAAGERQAVGLLDAKTVHEIENFAQAEADAVVSGDPNFHRRDLGNAIAAGDAPEWRLEMQIVPFEDAAEYRFNPFDVTKAVPHADYPPTTVGRFVLPPTRPTISPRSSRRRSPSEASFRASA